MKRLTERVHFFQSPTGPDGSGGAERAAPVGLYESWADVRQINSSREFQTMQVVGMVNVEITMRYNRAFAPSLETYAVWRGKRLTIHSTPDLTEKNWVKILAWYDPAIAIDQ